MANYATLKAAIQQVIKTNGNNEITGALLQQSLLSMINSLGANYQFVGIANTSTNPGTPDQNVFYIAGSGTYPNFNNSVIPDGNIGVFKYNGSWTTETVPVGKNYEDEIDSLKLNSGIAKYSIQASGFKNGLYWYNNGGQLASMTTHASLAGTIKPIPVTPDEQIKFSIQIQLNQWGIIFANASGTIVGSYSYPLPDELNGTVVVPNGAEFAYFNTLQSAVPNSYVIVGVLFFGDIQQEIDAKQDEIDTNKLHGGIAKYSVQSNGFKPGLYWYVNNNRVASLTTHATLAGTVKPIPIKPGDKINFSIALASGQNGIILADSSGNVIEYHTALDIDDLNGQLTVPAGCAFAYFNTLQANIADSYVIVGVLFLDNLQAQIDRNTNSLFVIPDVEVQTGKAVNASTGAISDVAGNNAVVIDLTQTKAKILKFIQTISSSYGYGFIVNGVWQGYYNRSFPSGLNYYERTIQVPDGATEFRFSWNTGLYSNDNPVYCFLTDGLLQAYAVIGQINSINETLQILDSAVFKEQTIDISNIVSDGGILLDGTFDTNNTFGRVEIQLDGNKSYRNFTFKKTYVNNATRSCYGFVVNGQWVGFPGVTSASGSEEITVNVPTGATVFRVSWNRNTISDANFVLKTDATIDNSSVDGANKPVFQFTPDFVLSRVPTTYPSPTSAQAANFKPADLYALYDGLMASYPQYITKIDCDSVAQSALGITPPAYMSGLHIYMYKFTPKIGGNGTATDQTSRVKVFITSMHPQEKFGTYATFYMAKMICENWKNDVNAEMLRSLVDIYIMPCPWVWNMQNNSRANYNGINGNRQFPTKNWHETGAGTDNWSGTAPLSEYEAKVINYFLLQIQPNVSLDVHTSGNDNVGHMGIMLVNRNDTPLVDLCGVIARTTSNRAIQDNANFPESPDECIYGVYPEDGSGLGEFYEYAYEQGCKFSILSEESPYSKWDDGVFDIDGPIIEEYTDGILREQIQYLFNTILRLTRQACVVYYQQ